MLRPVDGPMPRGCPRVVLGGPRLVRGTAAWNAPLGTPRRKDSREEGSRGAREPGNAPRGQGLDAELHGGAWYRGPVASVRSAAQTAGRASGVRSVDDDFFSVSCLTASPRFRDVRRPRILKTAVSDRLDIGLGLPMSNLALASPIGGRAPPLGVSSGPGPLRIPVGHEPRGRFSLAMGGATRVSDAGTRRASTAAGTTSRFGISGGDSLVAKRAAERLAASRREALELRTRLERAERRNAHLERSRGEGDPAGTERSPVGTTERDTANDETRLMKESESALRRRSATKSATKSDGTTDAERSPKRSPKHAPAHLDLARARRAIEDLRAENDELRGFARSAAAAENATSGAYDERADAPSDANGAFDAFSVPRRSLGGGAAATEREARRLEAIVAATTAQDEGMAGNDSLGDSLSATVSNETEENRLHIGVDSTPETDDGSSFRGSTRGDESDDEVVQATRELGVDSTLQGDAFRDSPASLRRALAALRAELRTQARARAILEEERDAFAKRVAETEEAVRASAAREAASAASLRAARQDALAAAALGEELARSCAEKIERAEAIASAWEEEARRLGKIERDDAERRVIAAAESAEAAAIESRILDASTRASSPTVKKNRVGDTTNGLEVRSVSRATRAPSPPPASPPATIPRQRRGSPFPERRLAGSGVSPSSSRDSPFADSAIFADADNKGHEGHNGHRAGSVARSPPSVSARGAIFATARMDNQSARGYARRNARSVGDAPGKENENENENENAENEKLMTTNGNSTPGEALAASLRRQSATLDALRGARARRDEELRRVRDRLDRLVASPRRVGFGDARMDNQSAYGQSVSDASPPPSARRGHLPREPYDRYADPSPERRLELRDAKTDCPYETASADPAETMICFANRRRAAPTHPSRAPTYVSGAGDVRGPLAGEKSQEGGKKSLFGSGLAMPAMSMPSMSSFGAPMAAMHKAAGTIQSAWRRKKKT